MEGETLVESIGYAKSVLKVWFVRAEALVLGLSSHAELVPLDCQKCELGEWLRGHEQCLRDCGAWPHLTQRHEILHDCLKRIMSVHNEKPGLWNQLLHSKEVEEEHDLRIQQMLPEFQTCFDNMLMSLMMLEHDLQEHQAHNHQAHSCKEKIVEMLDELEGDIETWLEPEQPVVDKGRA